MLRILLLLCAVSAGVSAQGIEFFQGSWEEALAKAQAEDKLIFVDAYASWCGPCKQMSAQVFPQAEVGKVFNANFINVKYDMEKAESTEFRRKHSVKAYPTLFFINAENDVVHQVVGGQQVTQLLSQASTAIAKMDDLDKLQADYEAGKEGVAYKYVRALVRNGEPHLKIANDYLRERGNKLNDEESLRLVYVSATEADSRIFDLFTKYRDEIVALEGEEGYTKQRERAIRSTFDKALEYKDEKLMSTAIKKTDAYDGDAAKVLELEGEFEMALRGNDSKDLVKATKNYLKKGTQGDLMRLRHVFSVLSNSRHLKDEKVIDLAVDAGAEVAGKSANGWRDYYELARFLQGQDRMEDALTYARKSLDALADGSPNYKRAIQGLIDQLEKGTK